MYLYIYISWSYIYYLDSVACTSKCITIRQNQTWFYHQQWTSQSSRNMRIVILIDTPTLNTTISLLWQNKCHKPTMTGAGWNPTHWWWLGDFTVTGGHRPRLASPGTKAPSRQPMINHTGRLEVWLGKCGMCGHNDRERERETERERERHTHTMVLWSCCILGCD